MEMNLKYVYKTQKEMKIEINKGNLSIFGKEWKWKYTERNWLIHSKILIINILTKEKNSEQFLDNKKLILFLNNWSI